MKVKIKDLQEGDVVCHPKYGQVQFVGLKRRLNLPDEAVITPHCYVLREIVCEGMAEIDHATGNGNQIVELIQS